MNQLYSLLLLLLIFITSCNGQDKTPVPNNSVSEANVTSAGQSKLIKTRGTDQYANVHCGLQDKAGNLWFGTTGEGVYRYDGKFFTNFTEKDGLSNDTIWSIVEDKTGNIWFGTETGVCRYDGKTITSIPIYPTNSNNFYLNNAPHHSLSAKNAVWSMMQDKNGKLWFGTSNGVYSYDGKYFTRFLDNNSLISGKGPHLKMVQCILEDRTGNIWFGSGIGEGIYRYDGNSVTRITPDRFGRVMSIIEDKAGNIWFGTSSHGVCLYDGKTFTNFTEEAGIDIWVYSVVEDNTGNLWFGAEDESGQEGEDGGVWRYDGKSFTQFTTKEGLSHNGVFCIVEDKSGSLWFGTRNTGLCRYDGKTFTSFSE